jgi:hypothetical protein
MTGCGGEPDRAAPVLDHHRHAIEIETEEQLLDDAGVLGRRKREYLRSARQSEAREVDGDAAIAANQAIDDLAVQERPRRVSVQQQQRRAATFLHVVHA